MRVGHIDPHDIIGLSHIKKHTLSLHTDIKIPQPNFKFILKSGEWPTGMTHILCLHFDDLFSCYQLIRERMI